MSLNLKKGFTLVELLIVIAILGTLAVVVLIALNPVQQLARTRDAGRVSTVAQLGHAAEAYATTNNGVYVPATGTGCTPANWVGCLVGAGEIASIPSGAAYTAGGVTAGCTENAVAGASGPATWCYDYVAANGAVVYARLESQAHNSRCTAPNVAYAAYSTAQGRGGVVCGATTGLNTTPALVFLP